MANPIQSGGTNFVGYGNLVGPLDLSSGGVVTSGNTSRVYVPHGSGYWMTFRPGRPINGFTTMNADRYGDNFSSGTGGGNGYLLDAIASFGISGCTPIATVAEGSGGPTENALDVAYIQVINGFDRIPNYALTSPLSGLTTRVSVQSGPWSSGQTWSGGTVPRSGEIARVYSGHRVLYDVSGTADTHVTVSVENYSWLEFRTSGNTMLTAQNVQVRELGTLSIGTSGSPVQSGTTAVIQITDVPVNSGYDPNQYGNGLVVLGTLRVYGQDRGLSYLKVASGAVSGQTSVKTWSGFPGWLPGDRLFVPDSRQIPYTTFVTYQASQSGFASGACWETRRFASGGAGNALFFDSGLTFQHAGPYGEDGTAVSGMLWHVANLTRNVVFRSQNASGTPGHVIFTGHALIDAHNFCVYQMGRTIGSGLNNTTFDGSGNVTNYGTNQIGRYPAHFHHCGGREAIEVSGNKYQFVVMGAVVDGGDLVHNRKWGVTVHGTHWGLVENNVVHNAFGGGFVLEDGSETNNKVRRNFAGRLPGLFGREDSDDPTLGFARQGAGYWCRSFLSQFEDNVAANCGAYGHVLNAVFLGNVNCPAYPGVHQHGGSVPGSVPRNGYFLGVSEFDGLEAYGYSTGAVTWWWLNSADVAPSYSAPRSPISNVQSWHPSIYSVFSYPICNVTLDRFRFRGDYSVLSGADAVFVQVVYPGDYRETNFTIQSGDIEGAYIGIQPNPYASEWINISDTRVRAAWGVLSSPPGAPGSAPNGVSMRPSVVMISGSDLAVTSRPVGGSPAKYEVHMQYNTHFDVANLVVQNDLYYSRSGVTHRLYFLEQSGGSLLPQSSGALVGCPESGLTNLQAYVKYQPYDYSVGVNTPVKPDAPNSGTPGLCLGNAVVPSGVSTPSWTNGYAEAL